MKKARDDREAAENARIAAAVAEADRKGEAAAQKLADMRRKMQQECDKVKAEQHRWVVYRPPPVSCDPESKGAETA